MLRLQQHTAQVVGVLLVLIHYLIAICCFCAREIVSITL